MIARLRGEVLENDGASVVVDCHGVGYHVLVPATVAFELVVGGTADLFVRHVFREDDQSLYGFVAVDQRRAFDLFRDVKGCGPKTALAILGSIGESGAMQAILAQDVKALTRVPGVGPRLAERIIVELKDKVPQIEFEQKLAAVVSRPKTAKQDELLEALLALGYRRQEAEAAAAEARDQADDVSEQIKIALRGLVR